jgi:hypothetical protein
MQSLYITEYITSALFLQYLKENSLPCDAILSDIQYDTDTFTFYSLTTKPSDITLLEYRDHACSVSSHPFIILHQLPVAFVQPLLEKYAEKPLTLINLYP